jgi:DUF1365 family protein
MSTSLLVGKVRHGRATPTVYGLEHDVWYAGFDLDDMDAAFQATSLLRRNRRWLLSFHDQDYMPVPAADIRADMRRHLEANGIVAKRVELITGPRVVGYQFNPASFYLCRSTDGTLIAVVVEVHNTYGERHLYTLEAAPGSSMFSAQMNKDFYVSPFIGASGRYSVTVRERTDSLAIGINLRQDGRPLLATSLNLRRMPLTTRNLARLALRHPLMPHRTIAAIHWHALRLWLRRVPWHSHAPVPTPVPVQGTVSGHGAAR